MSHRSILRRATAAGVVLAACAGLGPAVVPSLAYAADDPAAQEVVLPAGVRFLPRDETLLEAGTTGFLHYQEGSSGRQWTDYATVRPGAGRRLSRTGIPD
ncbi:hypothetical protein OG741_19370 [Streptomyces sp. NBC_01410]|uniref:hypothetical protein n=1 Tax=Streptomyces sp. NBC_01410 TaxID=2903856 RepID=UPI003254F3AD